MADLTVKTNQIDRLTGVYKKEYFYQEVRKLIDNNPGIRFAILEMDINRLTMINELMGIAEGDKLLAYIGSVLSEIFSQEKNSSYARVHADLFVVCCPYNEKRIFQYIELIEEAIKEYHIVFEILMSFGIYICEETDLNISIMCDRANMALKAVKGNYMRHYAYYDSLMHDRMLREQEIAQTMGRALKDREFVVFFQPKHSLDDERIIGAEALVRWKNPKKGMISPGEFIPVFEENAFIMKLDAYVWEETCRFIHKMLEDGKEVPPISVNVSRVNMYNQDLCKTFVHLIKRYNVPPELLELELTESAYTENPQLMLQIMQQLQKEGFHIAMDDFGSGYSSLNMLKDVPVDVLKIDLKFLACNDNPEKGTSIMAAIVRMAKWLGIPAIVEGVETKEQISFLKSIGCTMAQGYYYARPMPEEDFITYISSYSKTVNEIKRDKKSEEVLFDVEQFWQYGEENFDYIISLFSACGIYEVYQDQLELLRASDSYYQMIHSNRDQFYFDGLYLLGWIPEEDRKIVMKIFKDAEKKGNIGEGLYRRKCPDGTIIWQHAKARLLAEKDKRKIYFVVINDVTKYHQGM